MTSRYLRATVASLLVASGASLALATSAPDPGTPVMLARQALIGASATGTNAVGDPLIEASGLVPGHTVERCVTLGVGQSPPGVVHLFAEDVTGALADWLILRVSSGTGSADDCADFAGSPVYQGTLADLARSAASDGVDTGWSPADGARTFRVAAEVADDDHAAGTSATGTLTWAAVPVVVPPEAPPVDPPVEPPVDPSASPSPGPPVEPSADPPVEPPVDPPVEGPSLQPEPPPTGPTAPAEPSPVPADPPDLDDTPQGETVDTPPGEAEATPPAADPAPGIGPGIGPPAAPPAGDVTVTTDGERLRALAVDLARTAWLPLLLLLLLVIYLAVQDRLDRDDPKLALAPMHPDPLVHFPDPRSRP